MENSTVVSVADVQLKIYENDFSDFKMTKCSFLKFLSATQISVPNTMQRNVI